MKLIISLVALALVCCTDLNPKTEADSYRLISWQSTIDGLFLEMNFSPKLSFYRLENIVFRLGNTEFTENFDELDNYGCFFVDPKPEDVEVMGNDSEKVIRFSGGDGGATFNISLHIENSVLDSWVLSGSDIKDSPVKFSIQRR
jgi:hypothetical protein